MTNISRDRQDYGSEELHVSVFTPSPDTHAECEGLGSTVIHIQKQQSSSRISSPTVQAVKASPRDQVHEAYVALARGSELQLELQNRYVEELAQLMRQTGHRAATKTKTLEAKATEGGARDALEPLDTFQAAVYRPRWA